MKWNNVLMMLCGLLIAAGCGSDTGGRIPVSGRVTYEGEPLPAGRILFTPAAGNRGPSAGGIIEAGRYRIRADEGPIVGEHTITVTTGGTPQKGDGMGTRHGQALQIEAGRSFQFTHTFDADGDAELDFELVAGDSDG
jgi:hypothetical protein